MASPSESRTSHDRTDVSFPPTPYTETSDGDAPRNAMVCATPEPPPGGTIADFGAMEMLITATFPERSRTTSEVSR